MPWRANRVWDTTEGWAVCSAAGALQISGARGFVRGMRARCYLGEHGANTGECTFWALLYYAHYVK